MDAKAHRNAELAWTGIRVAFGLSLAGFHGWAKVFGGKMPDFVKTVAALGLPAPTFFAWCAGLSEFLGGALVAIGLFARPAAVFPAITMLVALYRHRVDPIAKWELATLYLVVMLACVLRGPGPYSLDARWFERLT
ncbi:MAG: DoxX family protein [Deltaproteobacteria bacterium]|nr:DoxX family protein [Deltaproteobacteria bacterium]